MRRYVRLSVLQSLPFSVGSMDSTAPGIKSYLYHNAATNILGTMWVYYRRPSRPTAKPIVYLNMYTSQEQLQDTRHIRSILMYVAPGLFSWSMAAGLLTLSSRQFAPISIMDLCPLHMIILFFLPGQAQRAANAARGVKRLVYTRLVMHRSSGSFTYYIQSSWRIP